MPKLHPILFSTPMVRGILEHRKTQTRRIIEPQPQAIPSSYSFMPMDEMIDKIKELSNQKMEVVHRYKNAAFASPKPKYLPGDILWVRESFYEPLCEALNGKFFYKADLVHQGWDFKCKPSIHMPFEAARIFLRITSIHPERLQDIKDPDAVAEGLETIAVRDTENFYKNYYSQDNTKAYGCAYHSFQSLWRNIHGKHAWLENPWVWVIKFERITKAEAMKEVNRA